MVLVVTICLSLTYDLESKAYKVIEYPKLNKNVFSNSFRCIITIHFFKITDSFNITIFGKKMVKLGWTIHWYAYLQIYSNQLKSLPKSKKQLFNILKWGGIQFYVKAWIIPLETLTLNSGIQLRTNNTRNSQVFKSNFHFQKLH